MATNFLTLDHINAYSISNNLSDYVWAIVSRWDWFNKKTLGVQLINAVDSVAGNIAEGFGRFHKKDKEKFYFNARGSLFEAIHWNKKAFSRKLITLKEFEHINTELDKLPKEINWLIKITEVKLSQ